MRQRFIFRRRKTELSARGVWEPVENEEDVVSEIRSRLQFAGIETTRIKERAKCPKCKAFTTKPSDVGIPDLIGYVPPRTLAKHQGAAGAGPFHAIPFYIEVKRPVGGVKRLAQIAFIEHAQRDGVLAFFANSWKVVCEEFKKLGVALPAA